MAILEDQLIEKIHSERASMRYNAAEGSIEFATFSLSERAVAASKSIKDALQRAEDSTRAKELIRSIGRAALHHTAAKARIPNGAAIPPNATPVNVKRPMFLNNTYLCTVDVLESRNQYYYKFQLPSGYNYKRKAFAATRTSVDLHYLKFDKVYHPRHKICFVAFSQDYTVHLQDYGRKRIIAAKKALLALTPPPVPAKIFSGPILQPALANRDTATCANVRVEAKLPPVEKVSYESLIQQIEEGTI